jgi:hypothetical protein
MRHFLDTSALAKLYHEEDGSQYVERLLTAPESNTVVSRLSLVEMESVLAIKVRTGELDVAGRDLARRRLRADVAQRRLTIGPPIDEGHYRKGARFARPLWGGARTSNSRRHPVGGCARTARVRSCFRFRRGGSAALRSGGGLRILDSRSRQPRGAHRLIQPACAEREGRPHCLRRLASLGAVPKDLLHAIRRFFVRSREEMSLQVHRKLDRGVAEAFGDSLFGCASSAISTKHYMWRRS